MPKPLPIPSPPIAPPPRLPKSGILAIAVPKTPSPRSCQAEIGLRQRPPGRNLGERPTQEGEREKRRRVGNPSKVQGARDNWRWGDGQDPKGKRETKMERDEESQRPRERASPLVRRELARDRAGGAQAALPASPHPAPGERLAAQSGVHKTRAPGAFASPLGLGSFLD